MCVSGSHNYLFTLVILFTQQSTSRFILKRTLVLSMTPPWPFLQNTVRAGEGGKSPWKMFRHNKITTQLTSWLLPSLLVCTERVEHPAVRTLAESFHISTVWQGVLSWKSTVQTDRLTALWVYLGIVYLGIVYLGKSTRAHTMVILFQIIMSTI